MAGESISIPILTPGADAAARNIKQVGNAAAETGGKLDVAAASLEVFNLAAAKSAKADQTLVQSQKAHAKATALLADTERVLAGEATKTTKLFADQGRVFKDAGRNLDDVAKAAVDAAGNNGLGALTGGPGGGGIAALIAGAAVLSPVIATVGTGLLGFGAAAAGVAAPILKAAHATGGLQANMSKLNPEQQKVAQGILGLGQEFSAFQKQMRPEVFGVFNQGLVLAGHLLHDVQPVAQATGKALGVMLGQIDAEFQSGTWQEFFGFMARTAGPDIQLLSKTFVGLLDVLPPLVQSLQPVATTLLKDTTGVLNLVSATEKIVAAQHKFTQEASNNTGWLGKLAHAAGDAFKQLVPGGVGVKHVADELGRLGDNSNAAAKGVQAVALGAIKAHAPFFDLTKAVNALNTSMTTLVGNLLTLQGDNIAWRQSMQAAKKQLDSNSAGLEGNSKNALANKQAIIASSNAAITFASDQLTLHKNLGQASDTIQAQIRFLQGLHDKSSLVRQEIKALREEEARLNQQRINQTVNVRGLGQWSVSQSLAPGAGHRRAAGGMIPGSGNSDNYPALLTPGEVVVPKGMVSAGAVDHLRGRLPGFASGGLVPSYSGAVGGVWPWIKMNDAATIRLMDEAIARATVAGMRAAQSAASFGGGTGGPASGTVRALQQYAASLFGQYGWSVPVQLPPLIALWNGESGWNPNARNPISGAYGIPQALPPGKMGAAAASGNAAAQIRWGEGYIAGVYGTPAEAYGMWLSRSPHWYDKGGYLPTGLSLAYNGTGRPEQVIPAGRGGGGNSYSITVNAGPTAHKAEIGRVVVEAIREYERRSGKGWRS